MPGGLLSSFRYAAGANAGRADANVFARAVNDRADAAQVRVPTPTGDVVRVADGVPVAGFLAAEFTCQCHCTVTPRAENCGIQRLLRIAEIGRCRKGFRGAPARRFWVQDETNGAGLGVWRGESGARIAA